MCQNYPWKSLKPANIETDCCFFTPNPNFIWYLRARLCEIHILIKIKSISRASRCSPCERQGRNEDVAGTYLLVLLKNYLFIFGCARSSLLQGLFSGCTEQGLLSGCGVRVSHCYGFSCCTFWTLGCLGFNSCGSWTQLPNSMWNLPFQGFSPCPLQWQAGS